MAVLRAWHASGAPGQSAVVVATEYQQDAAARRRLDDLGIDARCFAVRRTIPATKARPAAFTTEPAFPGYLLVRLHPPERSLIRRDYKHGIVGLLTAVGSDRPAVVPDTAMAKLLDLATTNAWTGDPHVLGQLDAHGRLTPVPKPGQPFEDWTDQELEVVDHPWLVGLTGRCVWSGRDRVAVLLSILGGDRRVEFHRDAVRPR